MTSLTFDTSSFTEPLISGLNQILHRLPAVIIGLLAGILVVRLLTHLTHGLLRLTALQKGFQEVLASIVEIVLWLFLTISLLNALGFKNVIVFFSGSVAAIGIAMAAGGSTLISDIIAGIFLARDTDFNVGDEVIVGETPTRGIIESMDARRTRIRDEEGVLHVIPNSVVERKEWVLVARRGTMTPLERAVRTTTEKLKNKRKPHKND